MFQNNTYEANGGHPIPQGHELDFPGIARSSGIARAFAIDDIAEFERQLPEILDGKRSDVRDVAHRGR